MEVVFTDRFLSRLEEFSDFIARDHIPAAVKWTEEELVKCEELSKQPVLGRAVPAFNRLALREIIHGKYRLVYEIKPNRIEMLIICILDKILELKIERYDFYRTQYPIIPFPKHFFFYG